MPSSLSSIDYFDHEADMGIIGRGKTVEQAFESAAKAVFNRVTDIAAVQPKKSIYIHFDESDTELALVTWLNLLITQSNIHHMVFNKFHLTRDNIHWKGEAWGETWRDDLERGIDVKGATLTALSVKKINHLWEARCVVDV